MSTQADCFFADFEWEGIQRPLRLARLEHGGRLITGSAAAMIDRNESYYLRCEVQGFSEHPFKPSLEFQERMSGEFSFSGQNEGRLITLSQCFIQSMDNKFDCDSGAYRNNTFTLCVHAGLVEQSAHGSWSEIAHIDWFLNGPQGHVFTAQSRRDRSQRYSRRIESLNGYGFNTEQGPGCGFSADAIVVRLPDFCFVVRRVPKEFGPAWTEKLAIDFSNKVSPIPSEETREGIVEFVSFMLGRRLIGIGDTTFGEDDVPFQLRGWNPSGINIRSLCSKIDFPPCPIDLRQFQKILAVEDLLKTLAPRYLRLRRALNLDHALWRYWTFQEMPVGINLPMIVNAMEILASAWFGSRFSASAGKFVSGKFFNELLAEDFANIRTKLSEAAKEEAPAKELSNEKVLDALMTRIRNSFLMGWKARMNQFFAELGLVLSEREIEALKARNEQTHAFADGAEAGDLWKHGEVLRTLFYKVMLRVLDYSGVFIDYGELRPELQKLDPGPKHNEAYRAVVYG